MEGIITKDNNRVKLFFSLLDNIQTNIEELAENNRPPFNGERFLTDKELSDLLKISRRCLQDYRDQGRIPYIQLGGKILYKVSDIEKLLEDNYHESLI
ncbi:helix-turn-helix domain-containing protein [Parabacteroides sp. AM08-6]|uniref:helix-turn-helix domain-containing protein n=1 Tax=Parabacteroides sp. AM08-6 TaxID=2292053 RepID=UPI000EFF34C7|nr:helix-turn-helix domain-containing protein [Parabacteroides sp. AM08-6]RHJ80274.1 DNA-binding protein [Parabacteroides sp. AM08-6]